MDKDFEVLLNKAKELANKKVLSNYLYYANVACALMTESGNIYTGINIDSKCALGNCAEHAAILDMLKNGETQIKKIVAYSYKQHIYSPCGKCRELIRMIDERNLNTEALVDENRTAIIKDLLPEIFISQESPSLD